MKKEKTLTDGLLRLNLQHFAAEDEEIPEDVGDEKKPTEDEPEDNTENVDEGKTFTQADVDRIVEQRLARERKKQKEEDDKKRKEEQGEYKELYEKTKQELAEITRKAILESEMLKAGYSEEQIEKYSKYVEGEEESEIAESVGGLVADIVPENLKGDVDNDPSPSPADRKNPQPKEGTDYGREAYQRIKKRKTGGK